MQLVVLVNPRAGRNSATAKVAEILRALAAAGVEAALVETAGPGHATVLARLAREAGADCLLVVGGDGTLNEVSQAYLNDDGTAVAGPDLGLVPCGTGSDLCRTFGVGGGVREAVRRLLTAPPRRVDLGVLELVSHTGEPITRTFVNIASFGIGGVADRIANRSRLGWSGRSTFFIATLRAMLSYRNAPVCLRIDGRAYLEGPVLSVALANGRYFGGGMLIAPEADPSDGLLDVIVLYDLSRAQGIALARKIYRGTHVGSPGVRISRGCEIEARPARAGQQVLVDLDGETPGRLPLRARVVPGALTLRL
jgi:diacylglycerol kinase (ATP)